MINSHLPKDYVGYTAEFKQLKIDPSRQKIGFLIPVLEDGKNDGGYLPVNPEDKDAFFTNFGQTVIGYSRLMLPIEDVEGMGFYSGEANVMPTDQDSITLIRILQNDQFTILSKNLALTIRPAVVEAIANEGVDWGKVDCSWVLRYAPSWPGLKGEPVLYQGDLRYKGGEKYYMAVEGRKSDLYYCPEKENLSGIDLKFHQGIGIDELEKIAKNPYVASVWFGVIDGI